MQNTNPTTAYDIALTLYHYGVDGIEDVNRYRDENGNLSLARVDFADGTILIAGEEEDEDGNPEGVTWSVYADEVELERWAGAVDGSPDLEDLDDVIRDMAAAAAANEN